MLKKLTAVVLFIAVAVSLTSCSKNDIFTDENGTEYIVVRDSNGNIVINDSNKLQVYMLNENGKKQKSDAGEYITEYIEFNGQVVFDRIVETAEMRFELPAYFSADENNPGYFHYEPYKGEIFFSYYDGDINKQISAEEMNCESLLESFGSETFEYEKYTIIINGIECTAFKHSCTSSEYYKNAFNYYIPYDTGLYIVNCTVSTDDAKKVDFDKFVQSIVLK